MPTHPFLSHLYNTYTNIIDGRLEDNKDAMAAPYDINLPIETLYRRIEEIVQYAATAKTPFTTARAVSTAFRIIQKSKCSSTTVRLRNDAQPLKKRGRS